MVSSIVSRRLSRAVASAAMVLAGLSWLGAPASAQTTAAAAPTVAHQAKVGAGIYEIAVDESSVYVASTGVNDQKIFVLDPKTLAVQRTIDVPAAAYGLGLNTKTHTLYTTNTRAGNVSAINTRTGAVLNVIKVDDDPRAHVFRALVDEATNTVYVSIAGTPGKIWVIDGATNQLKTIIEDAGTRTTGLAVDNAARRLYAASLGTNEIVAIDLATHKIAARWPAGGIRPTQLAIDTAGSRLFVTNQESGNITVIDTKTGALIKAVPTGAGALGIGFNPRLNQIYVANRQAGTVTVVDGKTYAVIADLQAGTLPNTVAIDPRTDAVYVTNKARGGRGAAPAPDEGGDTVTLIIPR